MPPQTITATFSGTSWDENPIKCTQDLPVKHTMLTMERKFDAPDIKGFATGSYIMTYHPETDDKICTFAGMQVFTGTLLGKEGSFTCSATGTYDNGVVDTKWIVVEGASTGELKGLKGTGWYKVTGKGMEAIPAEFTVEMP